MMVMMIASTTIIIIRPPRRPSVCRHDDDDDVMMLMIVISGIIIIHSTQAYTFSPKPPNILFQYIFIKQVQSGWATPHSHISFMAGANEYVNAANANMIKLYLII